MKTLEKENTAYLRLHDNRKELNRFNCCAIISMLPNVFTLTSGGEKVTIDKNSIAVVDNGVHFEFEDEMSNRFYAVAFKINENDLYFMVCEDDADNDFYRVDWIKDELEKINSNYYFPWK